MCILVLLDRAVLEGKVKSSLLELLNTLNTVLNNPNGILFSGLRSKSRYNQTKQINTQVNKWDGSVYQQV